MQELNNTNIKEFINTLFKPDEIVNITRIEEPEPDDRKAKIQSKNFPASHFPMIKNLPGQGTFICPNPIKPNSKRAEINLKCINTVFIDFDAPGMEVKESFRLLNEKNIAPNIISSRSEKNQHFYYLIEPLEATELNLRKYKLVVQTFIEKFGADKLVKNPAGLIRLPETIRYKDNTKQKYTVSVLSTSRYKIDDLIMALGLEIPIETQVENKKDKPKKEPEEKIENFDAAQYVISRNKKLYEVNKIETGKGRSHKLLHLGYECRDWNIDKEKSLEIALKLNDEIFDYPEKEYIVRHQINSAFRYARNEAGQRLKEFEEAGTLKEQNALLIKAHEEEKVREKLKNYCFILEALIVVHKTKPAQYAGKEQISSFLHSTVGTTFSMNRILLRGLIQKYDKIDFRPDIPKNEFKDEHGYLILNKYIGLPFEKIKSKDVNPTGVTLFINHLKYLTNSKYEYETLLSYMAHKLQKPGVKIPYAPLMINRLHGTGRSWMAKLFEKFLTSYTINIDHNNLKGGYTQWRKDKLTVFIHEIKDNDHFSFMDSFKTYITESAAFIDEKYSRSYYQTDCINYFFFSNHVDAVKIDNSDRRLFVVLSERPPQGQDYYDNLYGILDNPEMLTSIYEFLMSYNLENFNPNRRPEMTAGKKILIESTTSELNLYLDELKQDHELFKNEFVLIRDVQNYVQMNGSEIVKRKVSEKQLKIYLMNSGFYEKDINRTIAGQRIHRRAWVKDLTAKISDETITKICGLNLAENKTETGEY